MRYTREINLKLFGDTRRARSLEKLARTFLGQVINQDVALGGLTFSSRRRPLPDGSLIEVTYIRGLPPLVVITVPIREPVVLEQDQLDPLWVAVNDGANPGTQIKRVAKVDFRELTIIDPDGTWPHLTLETTGLSRLSATEALTRNIDGRLINLQTGAIEWTPDHTHSGTVYGSLVQWYVNRRSDRMINALYGSGTASPDDGDRLYTWPSGNFIKIVTDPFELQWGVPQSNGMKSAISDNGKLFMVAGGNISGDPAGRIVAGLYDNAGDNYWFGSLGVDGDMLSPRGAFCTDKYAAAVLQDSAGQKLFVLHTPDDVSVGDVVGQTAAGGFSPRWNDVAIRGDQLFLLEETTLANGDKQFNILEYDLPDLTFARRLDNVLTVLETSWNEYGSLD